MSRPFSLPLDAPVVALPMGPSTPVLLSGSLTSRYDGVEIDAATSVWPSDRVGDCGGLVDFEAGGLTLTAYDADAHVVRAEAKPGAVAEACARHGTTTPCLVLRTADLAHGRLLTSKQWLSTIEGGLMVEIAPARPLEPPDSRALVASVARGVGWSIVTLVVIALVALGLLRARRARLPLRRFARLVRRVRKAAHAVDPVLAELLAPALRDADRAVRRRRIDPASCEGRRLARTLEELHAGLLARSDEGRERAARAVVDDLRHDFALAVEAATEAAACR